ncbi:hypothetical protein [Nocardia arizonensis]|uniref:hypothetical protein n=1 Tax=Nocardia arizonensis TaxID=1141647 RepID=UPI0006D03B61|nr:hypothetical protein [Nocardia arizonensis]
MRGRARFAVAFTAVVALTGVCGALLLLPKLAQPRTTSAQPGVAASLGEVTADDPRLDPVRRTMEPFGEIVAERFPAAGNDRDALVVGHADQRSEMAVLGAELAPATAAITDLLGGGHVPTALIVVAANSSEFAALVRSTSILPGAVAAVTVTDPFARGTEPTQRVVFSPEAGRRLSSAELRTLLRHELTHVATRAITADGAPPWMLEGFAEYAAHRGQDHPFAEIAPTVAARLRSGAVPTELPTPADLTGPHAAEAYEAAWTACAFTAEKFGEQALVTLYRHLAATPADNQAEDRVLRETLKVDRQTFITQWQTWLSTHTP